MTASKTLTTAVAAATIVGAISFAYAQTTDSSSSPPAQGAPATEKSQNPTAAPGATTTEPSATPQSTSPSPSMSSTPSSSTPSSSDSSSSSTSSSEPAPKADRN